jgi:hypothetical protein
MSGRGARGGVTVSQQRVLCREQSAVYTAMTFREMKQGPSGSAIRCLKPPQAAVVKGHGDERCGKVETGFRYDRCD